MKHVKDGYLNNVKSRRQTRVEREESQIEEFLSFTEKSNKKLGVMIHISRPCIHPYGY